jgi:midasin (ATPase involved in ribosome maturation)
MLEKYSSISRVEAIKKILVELKTLNVGIRSNEVQKLLDNLNTLVEGIAEDEILRNENLADNVRLFVKGLIEILHNLGIIETSNFYSLQWEMRKDINASINDIFGIECIFKDDRLELYAKDKK